MVERGRKDWDAIYGQMLKDGRQGCMHLTLDQGDIDFHNALKRSCHFDEAGTVVDYGCGQCLWRPFVKDVFKPWKYVGMDISQTIVDWCRDRFPEDDFLTADNPIPSCDAIWCKSVMQGLTDENYMTTLCAMRDAVGFGHIFILDSEVREHTDRYYVCRMDGDHFSIFAKCGMVCPVSYTIDLNGIPHNLYDIQRAT